jgi:hypothetical protein
LNYARTLINFQERSKLIDPCEKEQVDVIAHITDQEREDIASSAQHALRLIAYNQIYKILGIDRLPDQLPPNSQNGGGAKFTGMKRRADGSSAGQIQDSHQKNLILPAVVENPAATGQEEIPAGESSEVCENLLHNLVNMYRPQRIWKKSNSKLHRMS